MGLGVAVGVDVGTGVGVGLDMDVGTVVGTAVAVGAGVVSFPLPQAINVGTIKASTRNRVANLYLRLLF